MKHLIFLVLVFSLASCGSDETVEPRTNDEAYRVLIDGEKVDFQFYETTSKYSQVSDKAILKFKMSNADDTGHLQVSFNIDDIDVIPSGVYDSEAADLFYYGAICSSSGATEYTETNTVNAEEFLNVYIDKFDGEKIWGRIEGRLFHFKYIYGDQNPALYDCIKEGAKVEVFMEGVTVKF